MNRPTIDQFFPDNITPDDINRLFLRNPELYQYIIALDAYVDWLEEKHDDKILSEVNFQIVKPYTQEEINDKYHNGLCPECNGKLIQNGTINDGWTYKTHCNICGTNYLFDESDMGQSLPYLRKNPNQ